jgi:thiamine-phosphate pyrophosphorylase
MIDFRLYLITDRHQCAERPLLEVLRATREAGVRAVQLREKDLGPGEVFKLAEAVCAVLRPGGARLFLNDRADIARAVGAAGVHLPETGIPVGAARRALGPGGIVGVSTHDPDGARRAEEAGADFITFGPVFFTPSKAAYGQPLGLERLEAVARQVTLPVFAIGGVRPDRVGPCLDAGARGVAVISAILAAPDPGAAVRAFGEELGGL